MRADWEVNVSYKYFSTSIKDAEIKIDENSKYVLSVVEVLPLEPVEGVAIPMYKLELKYINTLTSEEVSLAMDKDEAKQFVDLFSRMIKHI